MKKIYITILMFLAIFLNIDGVKADSTTYPGYCNLQEKKEDINDGYCNYLCGAWEDVDGKRYYYKFNYSVSSNGGELSHSIYDVVTDGNCYLFRDEESCGTKPFVVFHIDDNLKSHPDRSYFVKDNQLLCRNVKLDLVVNFNTVPSGNTEHQYWDNDIKIHEDLDALGDELNNEYNTEDNVCGSFGDKNSKMVIFLKKIYKYVKILIPIVIIILSIIDFIKVLVSGKEDDTKKAISKFVKRIIVAIIFILVPTIISLLINISGLSEQYEGLNDGLKSLTCILG